MNIDDAWGGNSLWVGVDKLIPEFDDLGVTFALPVDGEADACVTLDYEGISELIAFLQAAQKELGDA